MKVYYQLQKDLPDIKAGAVFESVKGGGHYQYSSTRYDAFTVERQPEWFTKITEFEAGKASVFDYDRPRSVRNLFNKQP